MRIIWVHSCICVYVCRCVIVDHVDPADLNDFKVTNRARFSGDYFLLRLLTNHSNDSGICVKSKQKDKVNLLNYEPKQKG